MGALVEIGAEGRRVEAPEHSHGLEGGSRRETWHGTSLTFWTLSGNEYESFVDCMTSKHTIEATQRTVAATKGKAISSTLGARGRIELFALLGRAGGRDNL